MSWQLWCFHISLFSIGLTHMRAYQRSRSECCLEFYRVIHTGKFNPIPTVETTHFSLLVQTAITSAQSLSSWNSKFEIYCLIISSHFYIAFIMFHENIIRIFPPFSPNPNGFSFWMDGEHHTYTHSKWLSEIDKLRTGFRFQFSHTSQQIYDQPGVEGTQETCQRLREIAKVQNNIRYRINNSVFCQKIWWIY